MLAALAVVIGLFVAPADASQVEIKNARFTDDKGQERKDAPVMPGDILILAFDIEGLTAMDGGKVVYSEATEVLDKDGKTLFKAGPGDHETVYYQGRSYVPGKSRLSLGGATVPGEYTWRITVADRAVKDGGQPVILERKFTVVRP